jgi:hypothetical protein
MISHKWESRKTGYSLGVSVIPKLMTASYSLLQLGFNVSCVGNDAKPQKDLPGFGIFWNGFGAMADLLHH